MTGLVQFQINKSFYFYQIKASHLNVILSQLDINLTEPDTNKTSSMKSERISKRGLIVFCSDLTDNQKNYNGLKHFRHKRK